MTTSAALGIVLVLAGLGGGAENCGNAGHHCFAVGNPGCDDTTCCVAVCLLDTTCCSVVWDSNCVAVALVQCDAPKCTVDCPARGTLEMDPCFSPVNSGCDAPPDSGTN